jgi:hypothetical protein
MAARDLAYSLDGAWRLVHDSGKLRVEKRMGFLWCRATVSESPFSGITLKSIALPEKNHAQH